MSCISIAYNNAAAADTPGEGIGGALHFIQQLSCAADAAQCLKSSLCRI